VRTVGGWIIMSRKRDRRLIPRKDRLMCVRKPRSCSRFELRVTPITIDWPASPAPALPSLCDAALHYAVPRVPELRGLTQLHRLSVSAAREPLKANWHCLLLYRPRLRRAQEVSHHFTNATRPSASAFSSRIFARTAVRCSAAMSRASMHELLGSCTIATSART
jgi:hypothetical protein